LAEITARELFAPLGPTYDRYARLLSFGQDPRWRRFLVSRVPPNSRVLDVATGTGAVALELQARGCTVVGLDQSPEMLDLARARGLDVVEGRAESLPFEDASFDALTFTYLLRYVDDPAATMRELARVVRPGGTLACLEFFVPPNPLWRSSWHLYTRTVMPLTGRLVSPEWAYTGRFLGRSISEFYRRYPLETQAGWWRGTGIAHPHHRVMSLGGGIVIWGVKR
jgi:demethylmenaquinone methyltransferase / 2-methoxy-6-polyprenyl-1,4-benzoquinol methylase